MLYVFDSLYVVVNGGVGDGVGFYCLFDMDGDD